MVDPSIDAVEDHLFSDRGIYRPGEIAHFRCSAHAKVIPSAPSVELRIMGPDMKAIAC